MSDPIVYRTTWPEVIDAYEAGMDRRREWSKRVDAFVEEHSGGRPPLVTRGFGSERFVGFHPTDTDVTDPPEGWRVHHEGVLIPDRRRKIGKHLAEAIAGIGSWSKPSLPGMPTESFTDGRILWPGIQRRWDTIYVRWSAEPDPPPSPDVWESCPLSEYYAAVEGQTS